MIIAEYIWIDAIGNLRSKARTLYSDNYPLWNFDGSSTGQADVNDSEVILQPISIYDDPLRSKTFSPNKQCKLVLCECLDKSMNPIKSNTYNKANDIFNKVKQSETWFGIEQEYVLYDKDRILGWPSDGEPEQQGKYYCGVGADRTFGRNIVEEHYNACLDAGLKISGINEEVLPGQWEYQIGPCEGISAANELWISRYLLHRICEKYNITASFEPKPIDHWNGSGLHVNYSTKQTRENIDDIYVAIDKLSKKHKYHMQNYGDNSKRLTGTHETSNPEIFTYGVGDRSSSIRIPLSVYNDKKGYLEDRRPASNGDPYIITSLISETTLL